MSLHEDLYSSAQRWAGTALDAFTEDPPDHDFAVHHMAVAVEHLTKAYLCSITEVLLIGKVPRVDDLLLLAGRSDKTSATRLDLWTAGGDDAIARADALRGRKPEKDGLLKRLRQVRNGVTHLGQGADLTQVRALLAAGIEYINDLLSELNKDLAAFWDVHEPLATSLVQQTISDLQLRVESKLRKARQILEQRFANVHGEAREAQIKALSQVPVLTRWYLVVPTTCPACESPGTASGREYSEEFGDWFEPKFFGCRVCELRLEGSELAQAGIKRSFFDESEDYHQPEGDYDYEPGEDDYR